MGLQKKAKEAMEPIRARVMDVIGDEGDEIAEGMMYIDFPSGLEAVLYDDEKLEIRHTFVGLLGGWAACQPPQIPDTLSILLSGLRVAA